MRTVASAPQLTGHIEVRNASFRYHPHAPWAIRDVSFSIEPGQKIAIVGRTGSGKSTLAMLLLGLYPLDEGKVLYDGLPLRVLNYRSLRSQFGVVLQEPSLFSGTIRRNIAAHDPELSLEQIRAAARLAAIDAEIMAMPMGYDTVIAEGGLDLAGGQRQRLAIARALAHRPTFLLLDEATSHLDALTEGSIDQNLSELECTRIVIAHRLSTVRNADLILVLDEGVIVERGVHEELLALGGAYATLVHDQEATLDWDVAMPERGLTGGQYQIETG
jgi:ABC-type bacteriocin/lantibiotic exporter with double-glycine peptidase domain